MCVCLDFVVNGKAVRFHFVTKQNSLAKEKSPFISFSAIHYVALVKNGKQLLKVCHTRKFKNIYSVGFSQYQIVLFKYLTQ